MGANIAGSYRSPSFEHALVSDAMRHGVITCPPEAPLRDVARTMATNHVHSVVVSAGGEPPAGVVSERQLLRAAGPDAENRTAASLAEDPITVLESDSLQRAAILMVDHGVSHVLVVDTSGRAIGVLSALDVAGVIAWGLA